MNLDMLTFRLKVMEMIEQGATEYELIPFIYSTFNVKYNLMTQKRLDFIASEVTSIGSILGLYENNREEYIKLKTALEEMKCN